MQYWRPILLFFLTAESRDLSKFFRVAEEWMFSVKNHFFNLNKKKLGEKGEN